MRTAQLLAALLLGVATTAPAPQTEPATPTTARPTDQARMPSPDVRLEPTNAFDAHPPNGPHLLHTEIADIIVRVRGATLCTGTPIAGTTLVVTAAHCVLDGDGRVAPTPTVLRDGVEHTATAAFVHIDYHHTPGPRLDAAVLVMDDVIPGPSALLGDELPTHGPMTVAGLQPIDTDGTLLRGTRFDNRPQPRGATGPIIKIDSAAAGCILDRAELTVHPTHITAPCGLIPGASGGGLFVERGNDILLVGVISTVAYDLSSNGLTPPISIHDLLADPDKYRHEIGDAPSNPSRPHITRS